MICLLHDYEAETQSYLFWDERLLMSCWIFGASIISNAIFEWFELIVCFEMFDLDECLKSDECTLPECFDTVQAALLYTVS